MTTMHRLLAQTAEIAKARPTLSRDALRHLMVVRPRDGEQVELFDGRGLVRRFRYVADGRTLEADGDATEVPRQSGRAVTLFACVTKGSRWDWTIEKATELGVARIVPVISERTIVRLPQSERAAKRERWMRIAEEAARQSDAAWLPEISEAVDFCDSVPLARATRCFVGALTNPPPRPMLCELDAAREDRESEWSLYVGPEGDFTPDELAALLSFATPVSLGPTVLRAETAAIFGISLLVAAKDGAMGQPS